MNVTMIPGYWMKSDSGAYVLLIPERGHEVARIFRGCARDVWVLCIGDYKHKAITGTLADAKAEIIAELGRRVRGT